MKWNDLAEMLKIIIKQTKIWIKRQIRFETISLNNAVTDLGSATELVRVLTGEMQPIMATGTVNGHNVSAVLVQADRRLYARYYDSTKNMIMEDMVDVLLPGTVQVSDIVA